MVTLPDLPQTEIAIVEMTNAFRKENKLGEVKPNTALAAAARAFADYLAKTGKFAHEADGREPAARAEQGYRYCLVAENLALNLDSRGFETRQLARDAVEGWKDSPGHRANLLAPEPPRSASPSRVRPTATPSSFPCSCSVGRKSLKVTSHRQSRGQDGALSAGRRKIAGRARPHDRHPRATAPDAAQLRCMPAAPKQLRAAQRRSLPGEPARSPSALKVDVERK